QYRYIHKSVRDYFVARALSELDTQMNKDALLNQEKMFIVDDPAVLQFLAERVQQKPSFKERLHGFVEKSKTDENFQIAAANAITILVKAKVYFNNKILSGIRIPKADLSYGVFDQARLDGADLTGVNLRGIWLRRGDLSRAKLAKVR